MNTGEASIEWLFSEQLKVDAEWSIRTPTGFKWWPDKNAQTIEVIGEETDPDGDTGYLISVRTEFLRDLDLTDRSADIVNLFIMRFAAMAGPVYDAKSRTQVHLRGPADETNPLARTLMARFGYRFTIWTVFVVVVLIVAVVGGTALHLASGQGFQPSSR